MAEQKTQNSKVTELAAENKRMHIMAYGLMALLFLVLVATVLRQFALTSILLIVAILYQMFIVRKQQKSYLRKCENTNLELTTLQKLDGVKIEEKPEDASEAEFLEAGFFPFVPKTVRFFKSITGKKGAFHIHSTDCSAAERQHETGVAADIVTGNWTQIELPEDTGLHVCILEDGLFPDELRKEFYEGQKLVELPRPEGMPGALHLYAEGPDAPLPGGAFFQKLRSFTAYTPGKLVVRIQGDTLNVFIRNRFLSSSFSVREPLTKEELLRDPFPELDHILELIPFLKG